MLKLIYGSALSTLRCLNNGKPAGICGPGISIGRTMSLGKLNA